MERLNRTIRRRTWLKAAGVAASSVLLLAAVVRSATRPRRQLGVALVGLGSYANSKLRPALRETEFCRLAGVVTGSAQKGAA